jgi:hypothetical protein
VNKAAALEAAAHMLGIIAGWNNAFSECDQMDSRWLALPSDKLMETLAMIGASYDEVAAAVKPWMIYEPSDYALGH